MKSLKSCYLNENAAQQIAYRAQLNSNRRDSTLRWMKLDIVT